jgi:hypothetical protein
MFIKSNLISSEALLRATVAALALLVPAAGMAQAPRPDFPGAKQQEPFYLQQQPAPDPGFSPRADFPGAKQPDTGTAKTPQSEWPGSQQEEAPSQK